MFKEVKAKLASIDNVLNEETIQKQYEADKANGYDRRRNYDALDGFRCMHLMKKSGTQSNYLIFEVALQEGREKYL